ncbi:MAG: type I-B CRISPR-associated protein Cas7/Cst2/DevR [Armatimonadetes bacterium]|nr:type I-B CRISPR-associated protein Cas7/Cst2/DevR [Armatimonadota bacterium]MDW8154304.1 type I-B CRISPR-associated protein Cas7/Cst2/DevR [Armatimonadota bacterium]
MSKAIVIGYLAKVSAANVNASHSEGNVVVAKKVTLPDGSTVPYISGQALRRMLRDRLEELGYPLSEPFAQVSGQEVTPPVRPWEFVDEDLFGYLDPSGGRRRTSPVRVSAAVGLFPFQGDRDLGTRSFERFGQAMAAGGNMYETELYANLFKGTILVELDRVGKWPSRYELIQPSKREKEQEREREEADSDKKKKEELRSVLDVLVKDTSPPQRGFWAELKPEVKRERLQKLLEALNILWGGGRTTRMLADLSPKFIAYARLRVKHPVFLEALSAHYEDGKYVLELEPLLNALQKIDDYREQTLFGLEPGVFGNEEEIRSTLAGYGAVLTVHEALAQAKQDVGTLWSQS